MKRWRPQPASRRVYVRRVILGMMSDWQTLRIGNMWAHAFGAPRFCGILDLVKR